MSQICENSHLYFFYILSEFKQGLLLLPAHFINSFSGLINSPYTSYNQRQMQLYEYDGHFDEKNAVQSSVLRIQALEMALERAIEDISLLQKNLSYVIGMKEEVESQLRVRQKREEAMMKQFRGELAKREREIDMLKGEREEIAELLADARDSLNSREATSLQREEERRRLERIVEEQRSTMQALEEQLLAAKYSSDLSYQSISFDNARVQELERECDELRMEAGKLKGHLQKETGRCRRAEKEQEQFKGWLGSMVGVRKVMEGCQHMLMKEIQNRLNGARY